MANEIELKKQARRLLKHLEAQGIQMPYNQGLEALAAVYGVANWNTLRASAGRPKAEESQDNVLQALIDAQGGYWTEHPDHPLSDWQYLVANDDTRQGYWEWVQAELEANSHDPVSSTPR